MIPGTEACPCLEAVRSKQVVIPFCQEVGWLPRLCTPAPASLAMYPVLFPWLWGEGQEHWVREKGEKEVRGRCVRIISQQLRELAEKSPTEHQCGVERGL